MEKPHYRTKQGWINAVDKHIHTSPHILNKLEVIADINSKGSDTYAQTMRDITGIQKAMSGSIDGLSSSVQQIPDQFNRLSGGIRELSLFAKDLNTIQTEHTTLLSKLTSSNDEQLHIHQSILDNSSQQTEIQSKIKDFSLITSQLIEKQLNIQKRQFIIQERAFELQKYQAELDAIRTYNSQSSLLLQQAQLEESKIQTGLKQIEGEKNTKKGQLDSLKKYFESEVTRINSSNVLPNIVKYLLVNKYIYFLNTNSETINIVSFLGLQFRVEFGSILESFHEISIELLPSIKDEIDNVLLNLKFCLLIDNVDSANDRLLKIEGFRGGLSNYINAEIEARDYFNTCKSNRIENPSEKLGFFQTITQGFFSKDNKDIFRQYREIEKNYISAKERYTYAMEIVKKKYIKIESSEKKLHNSGYPIDRTEFDLFVAYLFEQESIFLKKYPFFDDIRSAHTPF